MHEAVTRIWQEEDDGPKPCAPETVDPLEAGCARALAHVIKHDTDSNYATMAAREFLAMWRYVEGVDDEESDDRIAQVIREEQEFGRVLERGRIQRIIRDMITDRLRFIGLLSPECAREKTIALGALQEVLDAIDRPTEPKDPSPLASCMKAAA